MSRRPQLQLIAPGAAPAEGAAIVAALERFIADHATLPAAAPEPLNRWLRTARLEGVGRQSDGLTEWGDGHPWG